MKHQKLGLIAWLNLSFVHARVLHRISQQMLPEDTSPAQMQLLRFIIDNEGMTQMQIAEQLAMSKGNASQLLAKLEHCELISREKVGTANLIFSTEQGRKVIEESSPEFEALITESFSVLSPKEAQELVHLLGKLRRNLR